ncbi:MAG TPA: hypothetical protein VFW73_08655 [Lacipirellulaceae bacterium]|nr:hypothetical protein [Lacipirellulaceae bacterium]
MAQVDFTAPPTTRGPSARMTVYHALLIIALCAMLTACLFLYLEIKQFGGYGAVKGRITSLSAPVNVVFADAQIR